MKLPIIALLFLASLATSYTAEPAPNVLPDEALQALCAPGNATFYSLEPWARSKLWKRSFYGHKQLGKMNLDSTQKQVVAGAFQKAVREWDGILANCFNPRHALRVSSGGHTYDFLLCYECHHMDVYKDGKYLVELGATGSPKFLNSVLAAAHVPLSQTDTEEQQAAARKKSEEEDARWLAATPKSIQPYLTSLHDEPIPDVSALRRPLAREFPDVTQRILRLLEWYGNGAGPWSGYPSYEDAAARLLFDYPTMTILAAMQSTTLNDAEIEGTARFFGSWDFNKNRPADLSLLPASLKKMLLAHSLKSKDSDKKDRARAAFR